MVKIKEVPKRFLVTMLGLYKKFISPLLPQACIYIPTCSEYTKEAILHFGVVRGIFLGLLRILRCNFLFKGGKDLLPENFSIKDAFVKFSDFFMFRKG
jgi:putative membrane protein insertion efficiency factor